MAKNERKINLLLLALAAIVLAGGYIDGDWKKFTLHNGDPAAQQRALDRLLGAETKFDPAADDVTTYAAAKGDDMAWRDLAKAKPAGRHGALNVKYDPAIVRRDGDDVAITGYIFPLQGAGVQKRFLLSAYPPSCPYCLPGGPSEMIEVQAEGIPFTYQPVTLKGKFYLVQKPDELQEGIYYRLTGASQL